ncbi:MAG: DUF362 domain-containing protein [Candidatus Latescibacteria bacterium]|nr:DUF362 domain-containing protein [Candidatus Latescibacterota bacterium]
MKWRAWIGSTEGGAEQAVRDGFNHIGWKDIIQHDARVFIKPNLTYPKHKPGGTTTLAFIETVIRILKERTPNIAVGESDGGNRSYTAEVPIEGRDLYDITGRHGVDLVNLSRDSWRRLPVKRGLTTKHIPLSERLLDEFDMNRDSAEFRCRTFRLEHSKMDWFATAGFYSKWMTRIVYD